ncbi:MAG: SPFH domain-containing protein [Nanoarchaeota archaeon]|nr:SPFH domain-containing protein [Nanoarchaeota archaeon]
MAKRIIVGLVALFLLYFIGRGIWNWGICYEYCEPGESLLISRKMFGDAGKEGKYAGKNEKGVFEQMGGTGRHFYDPIQYTVSKVDNISVPPAHFYLVKNNIGAIPPAGKFITEPNEQGVQKDLLLTTGEWRINLYGQTPVTLENRNGKLEPVEAVDKNGKVIRKPLPMPRVDAGFVGVQTVQQQEGEMGDIIVPLQTVLQPGYYAINPLKISILPFEVGYVAWEAEVVMETVEITDPNGSKSTITRPKAGTGVYFTLKDGKPMALDLTVVYGIWPEDAPFAVQTYGPDWSDVEDKVIKPQVLSICQNEGGNLTTQEFIEGSLREEFQHKITVKMQEVGKQKRIHFLVALVRGFHPAEEIKIAIQARKLAEEERVTLDIERERDTVLAELEKAKKMVEIASTDYDAETTALVENEREQGQKKAAEVVAEANRSIADLKKQTAEINAEITRILGKADADVIEVTKKAEATKFQLLVEAYGGPAAYNLATFADLLPKEMKLEYRYSGPGTFWTNTESDLSGLATKKILQNSQEKTEIPYSPLISPANPE